MHSGTAVLSLKASGDLEGEYYTGRDRREYGAMYLCCVPSLPCQETSPISTSPKNSFVPPYKSEPAPKMTGSIR